MGPSRPLCLHSFHAFELSGFHQCTVADRTEAWCQLLREQPCRCRLKLPNVRNAPYNLRVHESPIGPRRDTGAELSGDRY